MLQGIFNLYFYLFYIQSKAGDLPVAACWMDVQQCFSFCQLSIQTACLLHIHADVHVFALLIHVLVLRLTKKKAR